MPLIHMLATPSTQGAKVWYHPYTSIVLLSLSCKDQSEYSVVTCACIPKHIGVKNDRESLVCTHGSKKQLLVLA